MLFFSFKSQCGISCFYISQPQQKYATIQPQFLLICDTFKKLSQKNILTHSSLSRTENYLSDLINLFLPFFLMLTHDKFLPTKPLLSIGFEFQRPFLTFARASPFIHFHFCMVTGKFLRFYKIQIPYVRCSEFIDKKRLKFKKPKDMTYFPCQ